jgi:photosystem I P700 chlorophyll a apoprotein A1
VVSVATWFNDVDAILNHHLAAVIGLGSLAWSGHLIHVSIPVDILLRLGCDPLSLPEGGKNLDPRLSSLLLSGGSLGDVFTLNWTELSPRSVPRDLSGTDVAHHQLAVAVVFLVAGHLYRTQFSIGTRLTS